MSIPVTWNDKQHRTQYLLKKYRYDHLKRVCQRLVKGINDFSLTDPRQGTLDL